MKNKHEDQQQDQDMNNSTKLEMEEKHPFIFIQVFEQIYRAIIWCLLGFRIIPSATRTSTADDISSGSTSCEEIHHQPNIPLESRVCEDDIDGDNDNVNDGKVDDDGCGEGDGYGGGGGNGGGYDGGGDGDGDCVIEPGTDFTPIDSEGIETKAIRKPQRPGIGGGRPGQIH